MQELEEPALEREGSGPLQGDAPCEGALSQEANPEVALTGHPLPSAKDEELRSGGGGLGMPCGIDEPERDPTSQGVGNPLATGDGGVGRQHQQWEQVQSGGSPPGNLGAEAQLEWDLDHLERGHGGGDAPVPHGAHVGRAVGEGTQQSELGGGLQQATEAEQRVGAEHWQWEGVAGGCEAAAGSEPRPTGSWQLTDWLTNRIAWVVGQLTRVQPGRRQEYWDFQLVVTLQSLRKNEEEVRSIRLLCYVTPEHQCIWRDLPETASTWQEIQNFHAGF